MRLLLVTFVIFVTALTFSSCKEEFGDDPNLYGSWGNGLALYTFNTDDSYTIEYLLAGDSTYPLFADSLFGSYLVDKKRSNITFKQEGYKLDSNDVIVIQNMNSTTWNYDIKGDIMTFNSNTSSGELKRK